MKDALKIEYGIDDWLSSDARDPSAYVQDITGTLLLTLDEDRMETVEIGKHTLCYVDFANGTSRFEPVVICDERSSDLSTLYVSAYEDGEVFPRCAPDAIGINLLYLDSLIIEKEHRGKGFGILAADSAIRNFSHGCSIVATLPAPMTELEEFEGADLEDAKLKLRADREALGFRLIEESDFMVLDMSLERPTVEDALQAYKKRKG